MARSSRYTSNKARQLGFASGLEVKTSDQLKGLKRFFEYESEKCKFKWYKSITNGCLITKDGKEVWQDSKLYKVVQRCNYTCDFMIMKSDGNPMFIETKGYFKAPDRTKHKLLKKRYPDADLRIIFMSNGKVSSKTNYGQWAEKEGITYHILTAAQKRNGDIIPQSWLEE